MADNTPQSLPTNISGSPIGGPDLTPQRRVAGGADVAQLLSEITKGIQSMTIASQEAGQVRASLIDRQKQEAMALGLLNRKLAETTASYKGLEKKYKLLQPGKEREAMFEDLANKKKEVASLQATTKAHAALLIQLDRGMAALARYRDIKSQEEHETRKAADKAKREKDQEAKTEKQTNVSANKFKEMAEGLGKVGGPIGGAMKLLSSRINIEKVGGLGKFAGGAMVIAQLLSDLFGRATRNTTDFVNAFGAQGGMYLRQQFILKNTAIPLNSLNMALLSHADVSKFASKTLAQGAFGQYQAQQLGVAGTDNMIKILATLTPQMMLVGKALGMTYDESAKLLAGLNNTMGVFAGVSGSAGAFSARLNDVFKRLSYVQNVTGMEMTRLISITTEFSATTLPLGVGFNTVTSQITGTTLALKDMAKGTDEITAAYLGNAANAEQFVKSLWAIGKGLTAEQTLGYGMVAGKAGTGDVFAQMMTTMAQSPFERLATQIQAFQGVMGSGKESYDKVAVALRMQAGYSDQLVVPLRKMMDQPERFQEMLAGMSTKDFSEEALAKIGKAAGVPELSAIAAKLTMGEDPMEKVVRALDNLIELAGSGISAILSLNGKGPMASMAGVMMRNAGPVKMMGSPNALRGGGNS